VLSIKNGVLITLIIDYGYDNIRYKLDKARLIKPIGKLTQDLRETWIKPLESILIWISNNRLLRPGSFSGWRAFIYLQTI
jgi:hypothetical protein